VGPRDPAAAVALIWGLVQYKRRNRANDPLTEKAAKVLYDDPAHYDEKSENLKKALKS